MAGFICILNLVMNGFSHQFLTYVIFHKSCCYLSFCFLLCAISIFLLSRCGTLPVIYLTLCCFFSIFCVRYHSVVFGCGTLPVRHLALCCFFSIFSVRYLSVAFGCGTLPVRYLALCSFFRCSLCDMFVRSSVEPCLWDTSIGCAVSFRSSLCDIVVLSSVVEPCLWDWCWPCAVYFRSSLCDIFIWYSVVEVCLWDGRWRCILSFGSPWTNNGQTQWHARSLSSLFASKRDSTKSFHTQSLREPCKSTSRIGEPCSPVFKEAQPRTSKQRVSVS